MILIVQICNLEFHYLEFVKPIEDILHRNNIAFESIHYKMLTDKLITRADKIIISGTSLKDNKFLNDINDFIWITELNKPILGICGGMHILSLIFDGKLKKQQEIGLTEIIFKKEFLGIKGKKQVYELHNFYVESKSYEIIGKSKKCSQAVKHKQKPIYGVLFHPEVRNKDLITNFADL
jgi:GMP synthase (glutamine-hydrolysing)